jgi:hypothetical protein
VLPIEGRNAHSLLSQFFIKTWCSQAKEEKITQTQQKHDRIINYKYIEKEIYFWQQIVPQI